MDIGTSIGKREQVIALLAQYSQQRKQILADWYIWFPWHQWWVEPLLAPSPDEKKTLDELSRRIQENEQRLN